MPYLISINVICGFYTIKNNTMFTQNNIIYYNFKKQTSYLVKSIKNTNHIMKLSNIRLNYFFITARMFLP